MEPDIPSQEPLDQAAGAAVWTVQNLERRVRELEAAYRQAMEASRTGFSPGSSIQPELARRPDRTPYYQLVDAALDIGGRMARAVQQFASGTPLRPPPSTAAAAVPASSLAGSPGQGAPGAAMAALTLPGTEPGKRTGGDFDVHNTGLQWVDGLRLTCPALVGSGAERIEGYRVTFQPAVINVAPRSAGRVHVTVDVPSGTRRGRYMGPVEAGGLPGYWCILSVDVT